EIQQAIWEGVTFVDFEHGLNFCIKQIRVALGDNAQAPRFIETLPRRGYRFIADVEWPSERSSQNVDTHPHSDESGFTVAAETKSLQNPSTLVALRTPRSARVALSAIVVLLIAASYAAWRLTTKPAGAGLGKRMLAVMPFENLSGNPEQEYFSD